MQISRWNSLIPVFVWVAGSALPVLGHVHIYPESVEAGAGQVNFQLQPPLHKALPMVEFGIEVEQEWLDRGGSLNAFEGIPGWDIHVELDSSERVQGVRWNGEELLGEGRPTQRASVGDTFRLIHLAMVVPEQAGEYAIRSWQKYSDGMVVHWNEEGGLAARSPYTTVRVTGRKLMTPAVLHGVSIGTALLALGISLVRFRAR